MEYEFDRRPLDALSKDIAGIAARCESPTPALQAAANELLAAIRNTITEQRGLNNERWAPKKGGGKALLGIAQDVTVTVNGDAIVFGVTGPGVFHQFGKTRRPFLPTDASGTPLFEQGAAKAWLERTQERVAAYVLRNER